MARQRRAAITAVAVAATAVAVLLPAALASMSVPVGRSTRFLKHWDTTKSLQVTLNEPKLCDPNVQQYSGYIDVAEEKHYFYWLLESRNNPATDPLILWLNGGPGCSSMIGMLAEKIGPCEINADGTERDNPHSWTNNATVIFLDAPNGAGYSYGSDLAQTSREYADDVYAFLQIFYAEFPKYAALDFHIFGESYAGHYIPALSTAIVAGNRAPDSINIPLLSIGIGNGMTDPLNQYEFFPKMACDNSYGIDFYEQAVCDYQTNHTQECLDLIERCYTGDRGICVAATLKCNTLFIVPSKFSRKNINIYDIRIECEERGLCYDFTPVVDYLRNEAVMAELGTTGHRWKECNYRINLQFQLIGGDWMRPYVVDVPPLLDEAGVRVLIYAGDADFICNWYGNKAWAERLDWSGKEGFNAAQDVQWIANGDLAGEAKTYGRGAVDAPVSNFTFLRVYEAGHMVPMDQPIWTADMLRRWFSLSPWGSK